MRCNSEEVGGSSYMIGAQQPEDGTFRNVPLYKASGPSIRMVFIRQSNGPVYRVPPARPGIVG